MTNTTLVLLIVAGGAGTLLIRLLPMLWQQRGDRIGRRPLLRNALEAIGPSAIVALLSVSLWSMASTQPSLDGILPMIAGLLGVFTGKKLLRSIAWATLSGVLAYGATLWLLSVSL